MDLEAIERAAWSDLFDAAPAALRGQLGMEVERIAGVTALRAPGIDHLLFNRAIGLCAGADERTVREIVDGYERAGVGRYFIHLRADPASEPIGRWLAELELCRFQRSWIKLARGTEPPAEVATDLNVVRADPARRFEIGQLLGQAFELPDAAHALMAAVVGRAGWHVYVALEGDQLAAAGALFARGPAAYLCFAATRPEYRRRGAQGALMARRIRMALDLGCNVVTSETGEQVPGDPQHSYRNMVRHGLRPVYRRDNWCPPGSAWRRSVA
jgi:GNAT superfamily N-acetyltransferase